jgi:hypothetical protein
MAGVFKIPMDITGKSWIDATGMPEQQAKS